MDLDTIINSLNKDIKEIINLRNSLPMGSTRGALTHIKGQLVISRLALNQYKKEQELLDETWYYIPMPQLSLYNKGGQAYLYKHKDEYLLADNYITREARFTESELKQVPKGYRRYAKKIKE